MRTTSPEPNHMGVCVIAESQGWTLVFLILILMGVRLWVFRTCLHEVDEDTHPSISRAEFYRRLGEAELHGMRVRPVFDEAERDLNRTDWGTFWFWIGYAVVFLAGAWLVSSPFQRALPLMVMMVFSLRHLLVEVISAIRHEEGLWRRVLDWAQIAVWLTAGYHGTSILTGADPSITRLVDGLPMASAAEGALRALLGAMFIVIAARLVRTTGIEATQRWKAEPVRGGTGSLAWLSSPGPGSRLRGTLLFGPLAHLVGPRVRLEELLVPWVGNASAAVAAHRLHYHPRLPLIAAPQFASTQAERCSSLAAALMNGDVAMVAFEPRAEVETIINEADNGGHKSGLLVVLPPADRSTTRKNLVILRFHLNLAELDMLALDDEEHCSPLIHHITAIGFTEAGTPVYYMSRSRTDVSLGASIRFALTLARGEAQPPFHGEIRRRFDPEFPLAPQ